MWRDQEKDGGKVEVGTWNVYGYDDTWNHDFSSWKLQTRWFRLSDKQWNDCLWMPRPEHQLNRITCIKFFERNLTANENKVVRKISGPTNGAGDWSCIQGLWFGSRCNEWTNGMGWLEGTRVSSKECGIWEKPEGRAKRRWWDQTGGSGQDGTKAFVSTAKSHLGFKVP